MMLVNRIKSIFRNVKFIKWVSQIGFLFFILYLFFNFLNQAFLNLERTSLPFSWRFLGTTPGIAISEGFKGYPDSGLEALQIGMYNMLRITISGIFSATVFGTFLGIARLSNNFIVNKSSTSLVEIIRNVPLLVQIFFWQVLMQNLPKLDETDLGTHYFHGTTKGLAILWPTPQNNSWLFSLWVLISIFITRKVYKWRINIIENTGKPSKPFLWTSLTFLLLILFGWFGGYMSMTLIGFVFGLLGDFFAFLPVIGYKVFIIFTILYFLIKELRKIFLKINRKEFKGKISEEELFKIVITFLLIFSIIFVMFLPFGNSLTSFLKGEELFFKKDWGIPQFFQGIENKLNYESYEAPFKITYPEVQQSGSLKIYSYSESTGKLISVGYFATWVGVVLYTTVFISEVVRSGIMAVSKGQTEAGLSLGLKRSNLLRLIVLPQALRIMLPPMGNQYLNLAKNTSLGIAVAYPEIVAVGQTLYNQEGQTIAVFLIWMLFYSSISLALSSVVNFYNRKMKIVER